MTRQCKWIGEIGDMGWLGLLVGAVVVLCAGRSLSKTGEAIAIKGNMGFAWVGMVFIAGATALPELFTSVSAVLREKSPDLAVGNCLGSIAFNLALVLLLDWVERRGNLLSLGNVRIAFPAALAICLLALLGVVLQMKDVQGILGGGTLLVGCVYLLGVRMIYRHEVGHQDAVSQDERTTANNSWVEGPWRNIWLRYLFLACVIFFSSLVLAWSGEWVAVRTGLGSTFVGFLLVAICTSLPEATATVTSIRLGKVDMALGNIIGSNLFNIFIICICDWIWEGPIAKDCSSQHLISIHLGCVLTAMLIMGITYKTKRRIGRIGLDTLCIFLTYLCGVLLLYRLALQP